MIRPKLLFHSYCFLIILLVTLPFSKSNAYLSNTYLIQIRLDYLVHLILFFPFIFLLKSAYTVKIFPAILFVLFFSALTEGIQYLLPYRFFNINDLLGNCLGSLFGLILLVRSVKVFLSSLLFRAQAE